MLIMPACLPAFTTHSYHKTAGSQVWTKTDNAVICDARTEVITTTVTRWSDGTYERSVSDLTCIYEAHSSVCTTVTRWRITYAPGDSESGKSTVISYQQND